MKIRMDYAIAIILPWLFFLAITSLERIHASIVACLILGIFSLSMSLLCLKIIKNRSEHVRHATDRTPGEPSPPIAWIEQYDNLTSLPNRIFFNELLNKSLSHAKRHHKTLAILCINIDEFNSVNTQFGPKVSDLVLREISKRLIQALRSEDVLAKLEGDEFIVLLNDIVKPKFASAVAEKLLQALSQPFLIEAHQIKLTASIGICIFPHDGDSLETLLRNVDSTLFKVKRAGGNAYQFYTQEIDNEAREYIQLKNDLIKAIENNNLTLYYQPKLNIKKGNITGVEALMRWVHPTLGVIEPSKFIPIAEEAGLMSKIGEWALREACKTNKSWQDEGYEHIIVALNLSAKQYQDKHFPALVTTVLNETGLNPSYLEFEITEKIVMDDLEHATQLLNAIKSTGVLISIDHFGTGATSISHLKQFPISVVKIDQSFIKGTTTNPDDSVITNALITLSQNLGFEVVAEGVETAEQVQYLSEHHCDVVQGYFLSHPLPAQKVVLQFKKLMDEIII